MTDSTNLANLTQDPRRNVPKAVKRVIWYVRLQMQNVLLLHVMHFNHMLLHGQFDSSSVSDPDTNSMPFPGAS